MMQTLNKSFGLSDHDNLFKVCFKFYKYQPKGGFPLKLFPRARVDLRLMIDILDIPLVEIDMN